MKIIKNTITLYIDVIWKKQTCADENSCNNLANEYDKLADKCNDAFKKHYQTDSNGKIIESTLCSRNENTATSFRKKATNYNARSTPLLNNGPILYPIKRTASNSPNYKERGGKRKKKSLKKRSYKKK
jgi:hypothetical protein